MTSFLLITSWILIIMSAINMYQAERNKIRIKKGLLRLKELIKKGEK